jgi:hypothetical protein
MAPRRPELSPHPPGNLSLVSDFLCESCGYNLKGAPPDSRCPECGQAVQESLPSAHPGSPWQRRRGIASWARTGWYTLFSPTRLFRSVSTAKVPRGLLAVNLLLSSALIVAPFTGVFIGDWARNVRGQGPLIETLAYAASFLAQAVAVAAVLFAFTLFDVYGITLYARTKGWRLTSRTAWIVCAHASAGWLVAGILPLLLMANYYVLGTLLKVDFTGEVTGASSGPAWTWQWVLGIGLPVLGYLLGLFAFEFAALRGARTCKFANPPGAHP